MSFAEVVNAIGTTRVLVVNFLVLLKFSFCFVVVIFDLMHDVETIFQLPRLSSGKSLRVKLTPSNLYLNSKNEVRGCQDKNQYYRLLCNSKVINADFFPNIDSVNKYFKVGKIFFCK